MSDIAFAQAAPGLGGPNSMMTLLPFILIFVIMYFMVIRPQQKKTKEHQELLNKQVRKLSLGERMKCELAAALLHRPSVLFLDEPTIGLDVNMQQAVRDFIADYNRRHGATILLTSHYMADVTALARRILVIEGGRLIFDGDLARLVEERAPHKILTLRFETAPPTARLAAYGTLRRVEEREAELLVARSQVTEVAGALLRDFAIADIGIEEAPVEEIVGELFGRAEAAP